MDSMDFLIELGSCEIPKKVSYKRAFILSAAAMVAVFVLTGVMIFRLTGTEKPVSDTLSPSQNAEESLPETYVNDMIAYAVAPYITCCNQLYAHTDNAYSELFLSEIRDTAYGFGGEMIEYEILSESGELSQRIYIRNPSGEEGTQNVFRPLYWIFDYVCDTDVNYKHTAIYGRYGLGIEGEFAYYSADGMDYNRCYFHPGELLQGGSIEVYECLTENDFPIEDLYIIKITNAEIEISEDLQNIYQSDQQKEYNLWENLYLLASPDWENIWSSLQTR